MESSSAPAHPHYDRLIAAARALPPLRVAVVHPADEVSLRAALESARLGLISPVLVGPRARIEAAARSLGASLEGLRIVECRTATRRPTWRSHWSCGARSMHS